MYIPLTKLTSLTAVHLYISYLSYFNCNTVRKKCPNTECFLVRIFPYLNWMQEIQTRKNSVFGRFLRSDRINCYKLCKLYPVH